MSLYGVHQEGSVNAVSIDTNKKTQLDLFRNHFSNVIMQLYYFHDGFLNTDNLSFKEL